MKNNKGYNMYFTKFPRTRYEKSLNLIWSTLNMVDMHIEQVNALLIPIWFRYLGLGILVHLFGSKKYKKLGRFVTMKGDWCTSFRGAEMKFKFFQIAFLFSSSLNSIECESNLLPFSSSLNSLLKDFFQLF